ncbi:LON peptidase substrate-binding domain-containing protein, partial [Myxococcota bacterium]|nr:LON peptidase substrate-binding domain-containing protein [Myxococcota bacterium]
MSKKIKNADILDEEKTPSEEDLPEILPTILLSDFVPFPGSVIPVILEKEERREAILDARGSHRHLLLINHRLPPKEGEKSPLDTTMGDKDAAHLFDSASMGFSRFSSAMMSSTPFEEILENELETKSKGSTASDSASDEQPDQSGLDTFAPIGVVCKMIKVFPLNEDHASALVQVLRRARPVELVKEASYATIRVEYPKESLKENRKSTALYRQIRTNLEKFMQVHPHINDELKIAALSMETPAKICDFAANHLSRDFAERQKLLFELDIKNRAHMVLEIVIRELDLLTLGNKISMEIREKVEGHQRDFFLREQLKSIRVELGEETDPAQLAYKDLARRLGELDLPEHVKERTDEQMSRLQLLPLESPEHNIIRSYIEWIVALPWSKLSEERDDIEEARQILDEDHYGLEEVKDRIIEFLAVRQKNPDNKGTMLCFSGPPGVGKTSLGQSIARALGRKFYRFSVGGMRDEAEIKGHRR